MHGVLDMHVKDPRLWISKKRCIWVLGVCCGLTSMAGQRLSSPWGSEPNTTTTVPALLLVLILLFPGVKKLEEAEYKRKYGGQQGGRLECSHFLFYFSPWIQGAAAAADTPCQSTTCTCFMDGLIQLKRLYCTVVTVTYSEIMTTDAPKTYYCNVIFKVFKSGDWSLAEPYPSLLKQRFHGEMQSGANFWSQNSKSPWCIEHINHEANTLGFSVNPSSL